MEVRLIRFASAGELEHRRLEDPGEIPGERGLDPVMFR